MCTFNRGNCYKTSLSPFTPSCIQSSINGTLTFAYLNGALFRVVHIPHRRMGLPILRTLCPQFNKRSFLYIFFHAIGGSHRRPTSRNGSIRQRNGPGVLRYFAGVICITCLRFRCPAFEQGSVHWQTGADYSHGNLYLRPNRAGRSCPRRVCR